jgi:hypothetical protein
VDTWTDSDELSTRDLARIHNRMLRQRARFRLEEGANRGPLDKLDKKAIEQVGMALAAMYAKRYRAEGFR